MEHPSSPPTVSEEAVAARAPDRLSPERQIHVHTLPVDVPQGGDALELHHAALEVVLADGHTQVAGRGDQPTGAGCPPVSNVVP